MAESNVKNSNGRCGKRKREDSRGREGGGEVGDDQAEVIIISSSSDEEDETAWATDDAPGTTDVSSSSTSAEHVTDSELQLEKIAPGTLVMAKRDHSDCFVRGKVIIKADEGGYSVLFGNVLEVVPLYQIAVPCPGRLMRWHGIRVCGLYEPPLPDSKGVARGFYTGTVGYAFGGTSKQLLVFFDNEIDAVVDEANIYLLLDQNFRFNDNSVQEIDRLGSWVLAPEPRQLFLKHFFKDFPEWKLVRMKRRGNSQRVNVTREGRAYAAFVLDVDYLFALLRFPEIGKPGGRCTQTNCAKHKHCDEWVYRGSIRLQAVREYIESREKRTSSVARMGYARVRSGVLEVIGAGVRRRRPDSPQSTVASGSEAQPSNSGSEFNMDDVYTVSGSESGAQSEGDDDVIVLEEETTRAKRSTKIPVGKTGKVRVLGQWKKRLIRLKIDDWTELSKRLQHEKCSHECLRDVDNLPDDHSLHSPYMRPLLCGWTREIVRKKRDDAVVRAVRYITPCGKKMGMLSRIATYLRDTESELTIDLFTFDLKVRPEVFYKTPKSYRIMDDFAFGNEGVRIPVTNEVDNKKPPEIEYVHGRDGLGECASLPISTSDFCSGCSCTGNCANSPDCECRALTKVENSRLERSLRSKGGYVYRLLPIDSEGVQSVLSGVYECNQNCHCSPTQCDIRVAQQPVKFPLELFMTSKKGWGVRSLVDIPSGAFVCLYTGETLTNDRADIEGTKLSFVYLADMNFYDRAEDQKRAAGVDLAHDDDEDYCSGEENNADQSQAEETSADDDDVIVLEDDDGMHSDEEVMILDEVPCGAKSSRASSSEVEIIEENVATSSSRPSQSGSVGADESTDARRWNLKQYFDRHGQPFLFLMNAINRGNIGRFINHSCEPNVKPQHVFIHSHDLRLPSIGLFTCKNIKAGEEIVFT